MAAGDHGGEKLDAPSERGTGLFIISDHFLGWSALFCQAREFVSREDAKLF